MCEPLQMTVAIVIDIDMEVAKVKATVTSINVEVVVEVVTEMGMGTQIEIESLRRRGGKRNGEMWRCRGETSKSKSAEFMDAQNFGKPHFLFKDSGTGELRFVAVRGISFPVIQR